MPNRCDCYITISGPNSNQFGSSVFNKLLLVYGDSFISSRVGAGGEYSIEFSPPHVPITPGDMVDWFDSETLRGFSIRCVWVSFHDEIYGTWIMLPRGYQSEAAYFEDSDQITHDDGPLLVSGNLLAFMRHWGIHGHYECAAE